MPAIVVFIRVTEFTLSWTADRGAFRCFQTLPEHEDDIAKVDIKNEGSHCYYQGKDIRSQYQEQEQVGDDIE